MPSVSPLNYIRNALSNGQSANAAYRAMRQDTQRLTEETGQQWTGLGRQSFLRLYGQTQAARAVVPTALDFDVDQLPDPSVITERDSRAGKGYLTWVWVYTRQVGSSEIDANPYVVRSDQPITPAEAIATARNGFEANQQNQHGTYFGHTFIGATYSGTQQLIPVER